MALGSLWTVRLHNDGTNRILDNLKIESINVLDSATSAAVVQTLITHDDYTHDAYIVKLTWIPGEIPTTSYTIANLLTACDAAITAAYGSGELTATTYS